MASTAPRRNEAVQPPLLGQVGNTGPATPAQLASPNQAEIVSLIVDGIDQLADLAEAGDRRAIRNLKLVANMTYSAVRGLDEITG